MTLDALVKPYAPRPVTFERLPFNHPVFILFTSGTTGQPKCIVHGAGGSLLQALKMFKLHADVRPGDRYFYYCTPNWVVWNILFCGLAAEASVMLYDGSPFAKNARILFDYAEKERFTHFGTSPKFLDAIIHSGVDLPASVFQAPVRAREVRPKSRSVPSVTELIARSGGAVPGGGHR